ncbi:MAG: RNA polymerase sigma factor, partial [Myxococcales bacterium]|nr:RNA polymerase sigma factor [Myxococcales bacterium]
LGRATLGWLVLSLSGSAAATEASVANSVPVVVRTVPMSGDTDVDPALAEIRVTFSKPKSTKDMWSFVYARPAAFPEITGPIRYVDDRTCVMPVRLAPGTTYGTWLNSRGNDAFRDTAGRPAVPYLLLFETR